MTSSRLTCSNIILAGGNSKRMGTNKLLLPWGSGTLFSNSLDIALSLFPEIYIVGDSSVEYTSEQRNVHFIDDVEKNGALNGLLIGLKAISHDRAVVFAADMPFITGQAVDCLLEQSKGYDVTIVLTDDGFHPLFGVYGRSCIPAIKQYLNSGIKKVYGFYHLVSARIIEVGNDPFWKHVLFNINHPDDYGKARLIRESVCVPDESK
jgi:molybdopterin-guanine dinucleotide biosynthesis protein A